jgi:hypothetical protein
MKPLKSVKVTRWISDTSFITYIFDTSLATSKDAIVINENIYQDDNIENAIKKIAYYISKTDKTIQFPFYAWSKKESLLFDIETIKWKGYSINPFKSKDRNSDELKEPITYIYKSGVFDRSNINITFLSDFKDKNKYYFIDNKLTASVDFTKREQNLKNLFNTNLEHTKILREIYNRIDLQSSLKSIPNLTIMFDLLKVNKNIQLIQWCEDNAHIIYKLYKKHKLSERLLNQFTNIDKIQTFNCINIYSVMNNGTYCKIIIKRDGTIIFSYVLDLRSAINWNDLTHNKTMLEKYIQNVTKHKLKLHEINVNLNIYYNIDNSSFQTLSKKIGEYIDVFHAMKLLTEKNKNKIICIYKRSNNYTKDPIDLSEYIKSRLNLGINDKDLVIELINLGINQTDAENLIRNEISALDLMNQLNKVKLQNTGTIVTLEQYKQGYLVNISNCSSKRELNNLIYWLSRIIENTRKIVKKQKVNSPKNVSPQPEPISPNFKSKSKSPASVDENIGKQSLDLGSDDDFFQGGALGKQKHGYFMNLLKNADKDLFGENYAREKCQASFQPLVLSKEEKQKLEDADLIKYFDNIIMHGSKPNIQNYYACPRIWCPVSKIPLDYNEDDPKCPLDNEEPMKLFWNKDKTKPRFVKLTEPDENGLSVPCCFKKNLIKKTNKKLPKVKDSNSRSVSIKDNDVQPIQPVDPIVKPIDPIKPTEPEEKDENYIMNKTAPIPYGRYGLVQEKLYKLLLPNVNYSQCSKTLNKTEKCLIRKGIQHRALAKNTSKDSILFACAYLLGFKDKQKFINDIKKKLDLVTFISLEGGNVCKDFLDMRPVLPEHNKRLCSRFLKSVKDNKYFDTNVTCTNMSYKLSRLLNIYKSYLKFLEFLESNDYPSDKNSYYLYTLIAALYNTLLLVWEKQDNDVNLICPYYTSFVDILANIDLNPNVMMILKEGHYYEPLEFKYRNIEGEKITKLKNYPNIKEILTECNKLNTHLNTDAQIFNQLYLLSQFVNTGVYNRPSNFKFKSVIINNDLTIDKFMTQANVLIKTGIMSISLLPSLIKKLGFNHIVFYDDIIGKEYDINITQSDYELFKHKCTENGVTVIIGNIDQLRDIYQLSKLIINERKITSNMIIHTDTLGFNNLYKYMQRTDENVRKWFQLQKYVVTKLLSVYDDAKLQSLNNKNKLDRLRELIQHFKNLPQKELKRIQIILEEIPTISREYIQKWLNDLLLYIKYDYFSGEIKENKNEFLFTQYNILNKLPRNLIAYHESLPNADFSDVHMTQYISKQDKVDSVLKDSLPILFKGAPEKLKSKWTKHKKLIWNHVVLKRTAYTKMVIPEFFEWIAQKLGYKNITYSEVIKVTQNKYFDIMNDTESMMNLLSDPSFYHEFIDKMNKINKTKKTFKTLQIFWDTYYEHTSEEEKTNIINAVIEDNKLYPNDLNLITISELINISILTIHRTKYGNAAKDLKRGELDDLLSSSTLFPAKSNITDRPLIILAKEHDKNYCSYYAITELNKDMYIQLKDAPNDIRVLVNAHLQ